MRIIIEIDESRGEAAVVSTSQGTYGAHGGLAVRPEPGTATSASTGDAINAGPAPAGPGAAGVAQGLSAPPAEQTGALSAGGAPSLG